MRRAIAAALVVAALLAGCGGDDEPKTVSKERYLADADVACASLSARFASAGATDPQTPQEIRQSADVLADLYGDLLDGLRAVRLPTDPADRAGAVQFVAAIRRTDEVLAPLRASAARFVDAAAGTDRREVTQAGIAVRRALDAFRAAQAAADRRAQAYGFDQCGNLD